jgi:hypothetical protein
VSNAELHFLISYEYSVSMLDFTSKFDYQDQYYYFMENLTQDSFDLPDSFRVIPVEFLSLFIRFFFIENETLSFEVSGDLFDDFFDKRFLNLEYLLARSYYFFNYNYFRVLNQFKDQRFLPVQRTNFYFTQRIYFESYMKFPIRVMGENYKFIENLDEKMKKNHLKELSEFGFFHYPSFSKTKTKNVLNLNSPLMLNSSP